MGNSSTNGKNFCFLVKFGAFVLGGGDSRWMDWGGSKHSAKSIRARIGPIRSKKHATVRWLKKDVADLIAAGHEANAYGRVKVFF